MIEHTKENSPHSETNAKDLLKSVKNMIKIHEEEDILSEEEIEELQIMEKILENTLGDIYET